MRLGADAPTAEPDIATAVGAILDKRLLRDNARPLAVALSGGGDSLALVLATAAWARAAGRRLLILNVDHGLQPESAAWAQACAATAVRMGADFQALAWTGEKPATGLPAAARIARHALLADAARIAGAGVILMGHTADDIAEAGRMRAAGSTTPDPREWAPSPAWPQGRGVFLLRPMLGLRRADIRAWLAARGETWIDDPANDDLRYARPRARRETGEAKGTTLAPPEAATLAGAWRSNSAGGLAIARAVLAAAAADAAVRGLAAACLCAAGTTKPPARARVEALLGRIVDGQVFTSTLAGARIETGRDEIRVLREAGEATRGGLSPLRIGAGETTVWDGRFEVVADRDTEVRTAAADEDLPPGLRGLPARVRLTLPTADAPLAIRALAHARLLAACGAVEVEPA